MRNRLGNLILLMGLLVLLAPAGMRVYGHWLVAREDRTFAVPARTISAAMTTAPGAPPTALARRAWEPARIVIPTIHVDAPIQKGTGNWRRIPGPAYETWSAGPGGLGNAVIASHRNMWDETFADLPRVRPGQPVYLVTRTHRYLYTVDWSRTMSVADSDVLDDTPGACVTLYTCVLPFNAQKRWVVRAHLTGAASL